MRKMRFFLALAFLVGTAPGFAQAIIDLGTIDETHPVSVNFPILPIFPGLSVSANVVLCETDTLPCGVDTPRNWSDILHAECTSSLFPPSVGCTAALLSDNLDGQDSELDVGLLNANLGGTIPPIFLPEGPLPGGGFGAILTLPGGLASVTLLSDTGPEVPEPSTLVLLGSGLIGLARLVRRRGMSFNRQ